MRSCFGHVNEQHDKACLSTTILFRRRNYAPKLHSLGVFVVLGDALSNFSSRGCSLKGYGVLKKINKLPSPNMGVRDPLLPSGTPPPLGIGLPSPKMRDLLLSFTKNFSDRTHITKRMPVLAEHPSRGEEGDSTRTEPVST